MRYYLVLEGTQDWKEEVRRFDDEQEARTFFNELVKDYKRQGNKFLKDCKNQEWEVALEFFDDEDFEILELETI